MVHQFQFRAMDVVQVCENIKVRISKHKSLASDRSVAFLHQTETQSVITFWSQDTL